MGTIARAGVAIGVVAYCLWPASEPGADAKGQAAGPLEIAAAQLSPAIQPPPTRNPFRPADAPPNRFADADQAAKAAARGGSAAAKGSARGAASAIADPLADLVLGATSVGSRRLAIINGRLYEPGQAVPLPEPSPGRCVVEEIRPYQVVLHCGDRRLALNYADKATGLQQAKGNNHPGPPPRPAPRPAGGQSAPQRPPQEHAKPPQKNSLTARGSPACNPGAFQRQYRRDQEAA
jgi:hypothetical protein